MATLIRFVLGASVGCLVFAPVVRAASAWDFPFEGGSFSQANSAAPGIAIGLHIGAPSPFTGTFTPPGGLQQGSFSRDIGNGTSQGYSSFAQFQAINATASGGTWQLSVNSTGGPSIYQFTADFSGFAASAIPQAVITSPLADATTTDNQPTIQWTQTGDAPQTLITLVNSDFSVNDTQLLAPGSTSFTPASPLPPGSYTFRLDVETFAAAVPVHPILLSGPDLQMKTSGTFQFDSAAEESFTIASPGGVVFVPEPTGMALFGAASAMFLRRRRRC